MDKTLDLKEVGELASSIAADLQALPLRNTPNAREVRRRYSQRLQQASPEFVLELARKLLKDYGLRWMAYELIRFHTVAFRSLTDVELEELSQGIHSWESVDSFARTLAGPAWLRGQASDELIHQWARSEDRWRRRAALVSTVALNVRSQGGKGDVPRTLEICSLFVDDHDDMVVKALSWALRELVVHDPEAVQDFLARHEEALAARVKREVRNKLNTGLKNPK